MPKLVASREVYTKLYAQPKWARTKEELLVLKKLRSAKNKKNQPDSEEDIDDILGDASNPIISSTKQKSLPSGSIHLTRVSDGNGKAYSQGVLTAVVWHPGSAILATAGLDKMVRLFHINGKSNPVVQCLQLKDFPVYRLCFSADGSMLFIAGKRKFYYALNVESGVIEKQTNINCAKINSFEYVHPVPVSESTPRAQMSFIARDGHLLFIDVATKQLCRDIKVASRDISNVSFSADGNIMLVCGGIGRNTVYLWDMQTSQCLGSFCDEGSTGTNMAFLSQNGHWLATGQSCGVVNIFDLRQLPRNWTADAAEHLNPQTVSLLFKTPFKAVMNLTTSITSMAFHPSSQLLAVSSSKKKDALRLVHLPTATVFRNWPTPSTPLGRVCQLAFSPNGKYATIGNDKGRVLLYRINHFI